MATTTCTVVISADGGRCGAPAITTFTTRRGDTFAECEAHDLAGATPAPAPVEKRAHTVLRTRSTAMYAMVDFDRAGTPRITGYAHKWESASRRMHQARRMGCPRMSYFPIIGGMVEVIV